MSKSQDRRTLAYEFSSEDMDCEACGGPIYRGEGYYFDLTQERVYCRDCLPSIQTACTVKILRLREGA